MRHFWSSYSLISLLFPCDGSRPRTTSSKLRFPTVRRNWSVANSQAKYEDQDDSIPTACYPLPCQEREGIYYHFEDELVASEAAAVVSVLPGAIKHLLLFSAPSWACTSIEDALSRPADISERYCCPKLRRRLRKSLSKSINRTVHAMWLQMASFRWGADADEESLIDGYVLSFRS